MEARAGSATTTCTTMQPGDATGVQERYGPAGGTGGIAAVIAGLVRGTVAAASGWGAMWLLIPAYARAVELARAV